MVRAKCTDTFGKLPVKTKALTFLLFLLPVFAVQAAGFCAELFAREIPNTFLETNKFTTHRNLDGYVAQVPFYQSPSIASMVMDLSPRSVWIDAGAGGYHALVMGLIRNQRIGQGVGISFKPVSEGDMADISVVEGRLQRLEGDYIEAMYLKGRLDAWVGKTDLITDIYGPLSYSERIVPLLQIYMNLLKPGGYLVFNLAVERNYKVEDGKYVILPQKSRVNTFIEDGESRADNFFYWLRRLRGVELMDHAENNEYATHWEKVHTFKLKKIDDEVDIPDNLRPIDYVNDRPPYRTFVIDPLPKPWEK